MQCGWHNCPQPVRDQVQRLRDAFGSLLGDDLVGVYLHGSLAMGCFSPERSDIDLLVITRRGMTVAEKRRAAETLLTVSNDPRPVEISVLREEDLRPWRHPAPYDFHYGEGAWRERFRRELASGAWRGWNDKRSRDPDLAAHVTVARARGICLEGAPITEVFPAVPADDYRDSIEGDLRWIMRNSIESPVYGVLNACRVLGYAETGRVFSKDEGAAWALGVLPAEHWGVIRRALAVYRGESDDEFLDRPEVERFLTAITERLPVAPRRCRR